LVDVLGDVGFEDFAVRRISR